MIARARFFFSLSSCAISKTLDSIPLREVSRAVREGAVRKVADGHCEIVRRVTGKLEVITHEADKEYVPGRQIGKVAART